MTTNNQHDTERGKVGIISTKNWNQTRMPTISNAIQYSSESFSQNLYARKTNQRSINQTGRSKIIPVYRRCEPINNGSIESLLKLRRALSEVTIKSIYTNNPMAENTCKISPIHSS